MILINKRTDTIDMNDPQRNAFIRFVKAYDGCLCLCCLEIIKLEGFAEDDDDYYYITRDKNGLIWTSCVADLIPLNLYLPKTLYKELVKVFNNNYCNEDC